VSAFGWGGWIRVFKNGAGHQVEPGRWPPPGSDNGLVEGIVGPVDVEVAKCDEVGAPGIALSGPAGQPPSDLLQFGDTVLRPWAVDDVEGDQGEGGWVAGEADRIGGGANWPLRVSSGMPAFSAATTSSQASPDGRTRWRSNTKARRSLLPCRPRVTSVTRNA
jgi:hypothetical protein